MSDRDRDPYAHLPHIDEDVEVLGLTDRDPAFFVQQAEREASGLGKDMASPIDRMIRRGRRTKGGT